MKSSNRFGRYEVTGRALTMLIALAAAPVACDPHEQGTSELLGEPTANEPINTSESALSWGSFPENGPTDEDTPIGLAFEIDNGVGVPLRVRRGQRFYINQIDIRTAIDTTTDEGVDGLSQSGDFADFDWDGVEFEEESFVGQPNADGTFSRRRFYRGADWMEDPSFFVVEQIDAGGHTLALPVVVGTGLEHIRTTLDSFFIRRLRAIQWTNDCVSPTSCDGASAYEEEALVELRSANGPNPNFKLRPAATALRVTWSLKPDDAYLVPLEQVSSPEWDYGFDIELDAVTAPAPDGTYAPGQAVTFQFTMLDGAGNRLHAPGTMPSYADFLAGEVDSGIQYWRASAEPYVTYYRRKHREKQIQLAIMGPMQETGPIYDVVDIFQRIDFQTGVVSVASPEQNGFYAAATGVPSYLSIFGGPSAWELPSTDTWTFTLPPDAEPGTYYVVLKARRSYLGEDIPKSQVLAIQVGSPTPTSPALDTGGCGNCHKKGGSFARTVHGLENRGACTTCHVPLSFELEGPVYVRTHFIHSRSNRFDAPLSSCSSCHQTAEGIQRTSKSACLSCHDSYPQSHVEAYGPVKDMFIGGGAESFQQCTNACHTSHPGSGL
ncbi:MAG: cytochrome C [Polyangiaceae bacterium]|nr:cytochrome C [Polyangiaceae bacterium]